MFHTLNVQTVALAVTLRKEPLIAVVLPSFDLTQALSVLPR